MKNQSSITNPFCRLITALEKSKLHKLKSQYSMIFYLGDCRIFIISDLPIQPETFHPKFEFFKKSKKADLSVRIKHCFSIPDITRSQLGQLQYNKPPWSIYRNGSYWIYSGYTHDYRDQPVDRLAIFNESHTNGVIFNDSDVQFKKGSLHSLTMFPTDQIIIANVLVNIQGCYLHSSGVNFAGHGLLFVGHSEAGKSTICSKLKGKAEILCDDRIIVRKRKEEYRIYGTWSHGDIPAVSGDSVPLKAIFFLEKSDTNEIIPLHDKKEISKRLVGTVIQPFVTKDWWQKILDILENMAEEVPCYILKSDKTGKIVEILKIEFIK